LGALLLLLLLGPLVLPLPPAPASVTIERRRQRSVSEEEDKEDDEATATAAPAAGAPQDDDAESAGAAARAPSKRAARCSIAATGEEGVRIRKTRGGGAVDDPPCENPCSLSLPSARARLEPSPAAADGQRAKEARVRPRPDGLLGVRDGAEVCRADERESSLSLLLTLRPKRK
jgi:hypothetical protein